MLKKHSFVIWILAFVLFLTLAMVLYNYAQNKQETGNQNPPRGVSDSSSDKFLVPDFTLQNNAGGNTKLSDYRGKVVVLNVWASWCPPCKAEMPEIQELSNELKQSGDAVLLSINATDGQRETIQTATAFLKNNHYDFLALFDTESEVMDIFYVTSIPATIVIDKNGYYVDRIVGSTTKSKVLQIVNGVR